MPGDTPLAEGVESTTRNLPSEGTMMMAGMLFRLGWRRISILVLRWVMSKQATFITTLKWGEIGGLDRRNDIEHTCFRQANAVAIIAQ